MLCTRCGLDVGHQSAFCSQCGMDLRSLQTSSGPLDGLIPTNNQSALTGYYLGVFSFACGIFLGLPAIIFGIKGLKNYNANPQVRGRTHSIVAIVLGTITTLATFAVIAASIIASMSRVE